MTEYITKEQAIDEVWDAFTMRDDPDLGRVIEENIERLLAADVVEVVRCKDCEHMRTISGEGWRIDTELYYCGENEILVSPVGYCSDGKRKDGGESDDQTKKSR